MSLKKPPAKRYLATLAILLSFCACVTLAYVGLRLMGGYGITFYKDFNSIQPGVPENRVIKLLGPPDERSLEFRLAQYEGFEHEYERAERSDSAYYLIWYKGIDAVYAIGFDKEDRVTIKAAGGT